MLLWSLLLRPLCLWFSCLLKSYAISRAALDEFGLRTRLKVYGNWSFVYQFGFSNPSGLSTLKFAHKLSILFQTLFSLEDNWIKLIMRTPSFALFHGNTSTKPTEQVVGGPKWKRINRSATGILDAKWAACGRPSGLSLILKTWVEKFRASERLWLPEKHLYPWKTLKSKLDPTLALWWVVAVVEGGKVITEDDVDDVF